MYFRIVRLESSFVSEDILVPCYVGEIPYRNDLKDCTSDLNALGIYDIGNVQTGAKMGFKWLVEANGKLYGVDIVSY